MTKCWRVDGGRELVGVGKLISRRLVGPFIPKCRSCLIHLILTQCNQLATHKTAYAGYVQGKQASEIERMSAALKRFGEITTESMSTFTGYHNMAGIMYFVRICSFFILAHDSLGALLPIRSGQAIGAKHMGSNQRLRRWIYLFKADYLSPGF